MEEPSAASLRPLAMDSADEPMSEEEAKRIIAENEKSNPRLTIPLPKLDFTEREAVLARAKQLGFASAELSRLNLSDKAVNILPFDMWRRHRIVPVKVDGNNLWIAMTDPSSAAILEEVRTVTGCRVIPVLAFGPDIDEKISLHVR